MSDPETKTPRSDSAYFYNGITGQVPVDFARELERALAASEERVAQLEKTLEILRVERCEQCNAELSQCGTLGPDGEPTLDCKECQLRESAEQLVTRAESAEALVAQLTKERDALRDDAERLGKALYESIGYVRHYFGMEDGGTNEVIDKLDAAIDSARGGQHG